MGPFVCPHCGTLVNQVPATCRVCGTKLTPPAHPEGAPIPSSTQPSGADSWMPFGSVRLLAFVLFTILGMPGLAYLALVILAPFGGANSGSLTFSLCAAAAFVAAVAWIFLIDRRASRRGNNSIDAGCLLILIGVAVLSGLSVALSLCRF